MIGGRLERADLLPDELTFLSYLEKVGRIECAPGSVIRADVIEQVVTHSGPFGVDFASFRRLDIRKARIAGKVDLSDCVAFPVRFAECVFTGAPESFDISRSETRDLRFSNCTFTGDIRGENSQVAGNLWLVDCVISGWVNLMLASVAGNFILDGCEIEGANDGSPSLALDGIQVGGLFQVFGCQMAGGLSIREARLGSQSLIRDSKFGSTDASLGQLLLQKTRFESEMTIGPNVHLDIVKAEAVRSESDLVLTGIRPRAQNLDLDLDRAELRGGLQIFHVDVKGRIALRGAAIASLQIASSRVRAPGIRPDGSVKEGSPDMAYAISADGIRVSGDVQLGPDLEALGEVRLIDGAIGGQIQYKRGATNIGVMMNLEGIRLGSAIFLDDMDSRSVVHLAAASVGGIFIDPTNLPHVSLLRTEYGFINDEDGKPPSIEVACHLLSLDHMSSSAVPYRRLARWYLEEQGDERASRALLIAGEKKLGSQRRSRVFRVIDNLWRWTVGYGYAPSRALWPFLVLLMVATIVFAFASGYTDPASWTATPTVLPVGAEQSVFNPFLFALSATVPFLPEFLSPWAPANPLMQILTVAFQIVGWLLITALVAGIANRLRRRG